MITDLKFYLSMFLRRIHYVILLFVVIAAGGIFYAMSLPDVYRAQARLLVESAQIPDDLAASTVRAGSSEMLGVIQQRLFTRANLLDTAERFDIYKNADPMTPDEMVNDMTDRIRIEVPTTQEGTGVVFVSFQASEAQVSADVTNTLVTQILELNVEMRTEATGQTLEFFEEEVRRLNRELGEQGARVLEFQLKNRDSLPQSVEFQRRRVISLQERISQINRELSSLTDRRARLVELFEQTGRLDLTESTLSPEQTQLRELQGDLAAALVIYSPDSPRVLALRTQVNALKQRVDAQSGPDAEGSELVTAYSLQISDIDGQISFLAEQKAELDQEIETLLDAINATPENAITLSTLERDMENIRTQFDQATVALAEARTGDRIEELSKGQRIVVIERASVPEVPSEPNRKLIIAASLAAGAGAGVALIILLELLNQTIRRPSEFTSALGQKPFATLPYVSTPAQKLRKGIFAVAIVAAVVVGVMQLASYVDANVMPLEELRAELLRMVGA